MDNDDWSDPTRLIPPYAITGGRTRPVLRPADLELETLIATTSPYTPPPPGLTQEQHTIVLLCRDMQSIAEVSAHLDVPIGVARVLVGDLATDGLITLHRPGTAATGGPNLDLLERVLHGLRAL
jgi:hypothetical protein